MKIELLVDDVTHVGPPDRAEQSILGMILGVFWPIKVVFVIGEPHCDVRTPS